MSSVNKYFCSFADKRLHRSLKRIGKQANETNYFSKIWLFNERMLEAHFRKEFEAFLKPDTFYLCAWKPQVILLALSRMKDGELLLYADSGCHINKYGLKRLEEYFNIAANSESGILATVFGEGMPEKNWTKGDTFQYFKVSDDRFITDTPQIQATTFIVKKCPKSVAFVKQWLAVFRHQPDLAYRNTFKHANMAGFLDHRSDQSFFSILGKLSKINLISADEVQLSSNWNIDMIGYPIWAKRDKEFDNSLLNNFSWPRLIRAIRRRLK